MRSRIGFLFFPAIVGCSAVHEVGVAPNGAPIARIELTQSNAYVIEGRHPILIDTGSASDMHALETGLRELDLRPGDLALAVVTHAHHDHAGLAHELQAAYGVKIMLGEGDADQAAAGRDDDLRPQNVTGFFLKPWLVKEFPEVQADVLVGAAPTSLRPWGIDGQVFEMPGHTRGSIVVLLSNHVAFVGDEMLGGYFGGAFFPHHPGEHYYQADPEANRANVKKLLAMGVETFYLGHGGPVVRADVERAYGD